MLALPSFLEVVFLEEREFSLEEDEGVAGV
jgi:hypothetical protein